MVLLQREPPARLDDDALDLVTLAIVDGLITDRSAGRVRLDASDVENEGKRKRK